MTTVILDPFLIGPPSPTALKAVDQPDTLAILEAAGVVFFVFTDGGTAVASLLIKEGYASSLSNGA